MNECDVAVRNPRNDMLLAGLIPPSEIFPDLVGMEHPNQGCEIISNLK
jgi:hypothetical protein